MVGLALILLAQGFSLLLILIGIARAWSESGQPDAGKWIFTVGLALLFAGIVAVYLWMSSRREATQTTRPRLVSMDNEGGGEGGGDGLVVASRNAAMRPKSRRWAYRAKRSPN